MSDYMEPLALFRSFRARGIFMALTQGGAARLRRFACPGLGLFRPFRTVSETRVKMVRDFATPERFATAEPSQQRNFKKRQRGTTGVVPERRYGIEEIGE